VVVSVRVDRKAGWRRNTKNLLVQDENGATRWTSPGCTSLCPPTKPRSRTSQRADARSLTYGFDGVYTDFQGLSGVPACFNKAHKHKTPLDSFESVPKVSS